MRHSEAKQKVVDRKRFAREMRRDQRRRQWACFFTRPIGHKYEEMFVHDAGMVTTEACVECGRRTG